MLKIKSIEDLFAKNDSEVNSQRLKALHVILIYLSEVALTLQSYRVGVGWENFETELAEMDADTLEEIKHEAVTTGKSIAEIKCEWGVYDSTDDPLLVSLEADIDMLLYTIGGALLKIERAEDFNKLIVSLKNDVVPGYIDILNRR